MYSINDIQRLMKSKELSVQPKYQRRRTPWPNNAKTGLIDTIINNFPIPPIYLRDYVDEKGKRQKQIIDGQQRVSTIIEFLKDQYKLTRVIGDSELIGSIFSTLPFEIQTQIEDYELAFISIKGASEADIISIFSRLNSFSLPLNTQEKRNAKYAGVMKSSIYALASRYNTFWQSFKILTSNQIARMADALLVSEIVYGVLKGVKSSTAKDIDTLYKDYEDDFKESSILSKNFKTVMSICGSFMENETIMKAFKTKYMFYSLFLAVYDKTFQLQTLKKKRIGKIEIEKTIKKLESFSIKVIEENFKTEDLYLLKQATGNTKNKAFRHKLISKQLVVS